MWRTPKVKATFGVLFMTKISKQIKLQAIQDYMSGKYSIRGITARYGIANSVFRMLIAAYKSFGSDILFNPPKITPEFRIKVASWAIQNNASHSQVAAKFGYYRHCPNCFVEEDLFTTRAKWVIIYSKRTIT